MSREELGSPESSGSRWARAGFARLAEVQRMAGEQIDRLIRTMTGADGLPALESHFEKHKPEFSASTAQEYEQLFLAHIRRSDLRVFTARHPDRNTVMWYLVGMDNGYVAQYNESQGRYWSFYRERNLNRHLDWAKGYWVEMEHTGDKWVARLWK